MQMSAAVWRNAVCGPGCAEIVVLGDGDIGHPPAEAVGSDIAGPPVTSVSGWNSRSAISLHGHPPSDRIWGLRTRAMCRMVEVAVAAVSEQRIFVAPLAVAGSAPDLGWYPA